MEGLSHGFPTSFARPSYVIRNPEGTCAVSQTFRIREYEIHVIVFQADSTTFTDGTCFASVVKRLTKQTS